ncbi:MAG: hypothetical protein PHH54_05900 [Candidatus Nanoarchaeia archaeon]|nr:hypothetical protein [Candidatus Nanoarchaeia archaeon]MDD5741488.1 hypothetical protein [Candidatus Nanoarchaeia archaeon]
MATKEIHHTWNHWHFLFNRVMEYAEILNGTHRSAYKYVESPKNETSERSYKTEMIEECKEIFDRKDYICQPFSVWLGKELDSSQEIISSLKDIGTDLRSARRLDEMAKDCNKSLRNACYGTGSLEWRKYYESCREANILIYGIPKNRDISGTIHSIKKSVFDH